MNLLKTFALTLLFVPAIGFAQVSTTTSALPGAGITPGSVLYFLDQLGEALQEFLTFNPEAKARLQVTFAAERIAEIQVLLETKGADAKGLDIAQSRLLANVAAAATILESETEDGKDISALAKEIKIEFDEKQDLLKQVFDEQERVFEAKEKELRTKIIAARQAGNTAEVESLLKELGEVKAQLALLELTEDEQEEALETEEENVEEHMEVREEAEEAIQEAEKGKQEMISDAVNDGAIAIVGGLVPGGTIISGAIATFDGLLSQAKSALTADNYEEAKRLAKQAEKSLENVEETIENQKEEKDKQEELKEEREEEEKAQKNNEGKEEETYSEDEED